MAIGDPYATLAELKESFNPQIVDTDDDDRLTGALAAASRAVNRFCARQFQKDDAATERRYRALTPTLLLVDDFHTTTDLVIDGTAFDDDTHALEPEGGIVDGEPGWPFWRIRGTGFSGRVAVTAQWGWAAVPAPVKESTLITAMEIFKMRDSLYGIQGMQDFGYIRLRENHRTASMLAPYRRRAVEVA